MTAHEIINRLGGTVKVASLCKVRPQAVSGWKKKGIPEAREMYLKLVNPEAFTERRAASRKKAPPAQGGASTNPIP